MKLQVHINLDQKYQRSSIKPNDKKYPAVIYIYLLATLAIGSLLLSIFNAEWFLWNITLDSDFLLSFLTASLEIVGVISIVTTLVASRLSLFSKEDVDNIEDILYNFRKFMNVAVSFLIGVGLFIFIITVRFDRGEKIMIKSIEGNTTTLGLVLIFVIAHYLFKAVFSFIKNFRGPSQ